LFYVSCGVDDICDSAPRLAGKLIVTNHTVPEIEVCEPSVDELPVVCGDLVYIELVSPPCPDRADGFAERRPLGHAPSGAVPTAVDLRAALARAGRPEANPRVPTTREDLVFARGESVVLEVTGKDNCDNATIVLYDPTREPSPLCEEWLEEGEECCPALIAPEDKKCKPGLCGRCKATVDPLPVVFASPASGRACRVKQARDLAYMAAGTASCVDLYDPGCDGTCRTNDCQQMGDNYERQTLVDCNSILLPGCRHDRGFECTVSGPISCACACY
jgi:hypothetical protein